MFGQTYGQETSELAQVSDCHSRILLRYSSLCTIKIYMFGWLVGSFVR